MTDPVGTLANVNKIADSQARLRATVYVAGLESRVDEAVLADAFVPFGEIADVTIPKSEDEDSRDAHRGFGYVEFESANDAQEAIDNMDQSELFGRFIKVALAKPQKDMSHNLGSKTAIWEQEGYLAQHAVKDSERLDNPEPEADLPLASEDPMRALEGLDVAGPRPV